MVDIEQTYEQIRARAAKAGAARVILFGSRARGTNLPKSDIDLAVEGCPDFPAFKDALENDLPTLLNVDVVNLDTTSSTELKREVARDGKVLYEKVQ